MSHKETGTEAIEAAILLPIIVLILIFLLVFGFMFYSLQMVQLTADETAYRVAETYRYPTSDPMIGYYSLRDAERMDLDHVAADSTRAGYAADKGQHYARWILGISNFALITGDPVIDISFPWDSVTARHAVVTVTVKWELPLAGLFDYFGLNGRPTYSCTSYALATDYRRQIFSSLSFKGTVGLIDTLTGKTGKSVNALLSNVQGVVDLVKNIFYAIES